VGRADSLRLQLGTGDPDLAVEGTTLYLTNERPTGITYKELGLTDDAEQTVRAWLELDTDGDGTADQLREHVLPAGRSRLDLRKIRAEQVQLSLRLTTQNSQEGPMIRSLRLRTVLHRWIVETGDQGRFPETDAALEAVLKRWGEKAVNKEYDRVRPKRKK